MINVKPQDIVRENARSTGYSRWLEITLTPNIASQLEALNALAFIKKVTIRGRSCYVVGPELAKYIVILPIYPEHGTIELPEYLVSYD